MACTLALVKCMLFAVLLQCQWLITWITSYRWWCHYLVVKLASHRQPEDSKNIKCMNGLGTQCEELAKEKFIPFVLVTQCPLMSSVDIDKALILKIDEVTIIQEHCTSCPTLVNCWSYVQWQPEWHAAMGWDGYRRLIAIPPQLTPDSSQDYTMTYMRTCS